VQFEKNGSMDYDFLVLALGGVTSLVIQHLRTKTPAEPGATAGNRYRWRAFAEAASRPRKGPNEITPPPGRAGQMHQTCSLWACQSTAATVARFTTS
jgi:hypothetical protein